MIATQTYLQQSIQTAGPAHLVLALYDGLLASIRRAQHALSSDQLGATEQAHVELVRGQRIVSELQVGLNHEQGGDIASSLDSLYTYCMNELLEANLRKEPAGLEAVQRIIRVLRDSWDEACCSTQHATQ
jgi:flagellar protein FliS